jgi:hypothetical protein
VVTIHRLRVGRALSQVIGGFNVICTAWAAQNFIDAFYSGLDNRCAYNSCWPLGEQEIALVTPMIMVE